MREIPFGGDGDFSREKMVTRINAELANNIGNLAQRVLAMINKNCGGKVPEFKFLEGDKKLLAFAFVQADQIRNVIIYDQQFNRALELIVQIASRANEYVDTQEPWKLKKEDPERMNTVLYTLAECLRRIGLLLQPFVPDAASKLLDLLAVPEDKRLFHMVGAGSALRAGTELPTPSGLFPRIEEAKQ